MNDLAVVRNAIPAMSDEVISKVRTLEQTVFEQEQLALVTNHLLHGGLYMRTIKMLAGSVLTGALVKIPTTLIVNGVVSVYMGDKTKLFSGYNVIPASGGRKQAIYAYADSDLTMVFPTAAKTIQEAEEEFTDELDMLVSRNNPDSNVVVITGE